MYIVDISKELGDIERDIVDMLKDKNKPIILVINKIDKLKTEDELREIVELYQNLNMFEKIIPVSAINGENIDEILDKIVDILPEGPRYYEEDCITDLSVRKTSARTKTDTGRRGENPKVRGKTLVKELGKMHP